MSHVYRRHPENIVGAIYVDDSCINCGLCPSISPDNFREADDGTQSVCFHQPSTPDQVAACAEAIANCPTESIVEVASAGNTAVEENVI